MRKYSWSMAAVVAAFSIWFGLAVAADSAGAEYAGAYGGTWEGAGGAGRFDLTLTKGADGALSGGVSVGADTGDYVAKFVSLSFAGNKLAARYSYTPDEQGDIVLTATFEGNGAKGTWALVGKGQEASTAMANGTWTVTKK